MEQALEDIRSRQTSANDQLNRAHKDNVALCHRSSKAQSTIMANEKERKVVEEELRERKERQREAEKTVGVTCIVC